MRRLAVKEHLHRKFAGPWAPRNLHVHLKQARAHQSGGTPMTCTCSAWYGNPLSHPNGLSFLHEIGAVSRI